MQTALNPELSGKFLKQEGGSVFDFEQYVFRAVTKWDDQANEKNFYRVSGQCLITRKLQSQVVTDTAELYFSKAFAVLNDFDKDGTRISYSSSDSYISYGEEGELLAKELRLNLYVTDEAYYQYHNSVNGAMDESPFKEPAVVYTNVKGGLGVVSSYRKTELKLAL